MSDVPFGLVELGLDVVIGAREVGELPRGEQFVEGAAAGLHLGDLVLGALHRGAGVAHRRRDAADRLADVRRGLGRGVGRLDRLLLGAKGLDLGLEALAGVGQLLLLVDDGGVLGVEVLQLAGDGLAPREGLAGEGLVVLGQRGLGLVGQLVALVLQLLGLDLDALARGGDVGDGALHLGEVVELLLVGEVERLAGVLHLVQRRVRSWPERWC
jgi:hypothetical protein